MYVTENLELAFPSLKLATEQRPLLLPIPLKESTGPIEIRERDIARCNPELNCRVLRKGP